MKTLVVILGPTGVGKTDKTIEMAEQLHVPVINADSRQIFKEIPIGSAAPTKEQQKRVKHYFVGSHSIHDYYSAAQYEADVIALLEEQFRNSDYALLSGGSMMYIDAVCKGLDDIPTVDNATRDLFKRRLEKEGLEPLLDELKALDPEHYAIVDHNNPRRIMHALEICHMTGKTFTSFRKGIKKVRPFNIIKVGLERPRSEMYERINLRVRKMVENGLEEEARRVYRYRNLNSLNTVGFKELFQFFDGETDFEEAIRRIQSNTRRYMRKQVTWFRHDTDIKWYHPDDEIKII
jgi:tRNA dimethylallyltransferase